MKLFRGITAFFLVTSAIAEEVSVGEKLFALKVKPLLAQKGAACHGDDPKKLKGDLDMRTRESMLRGGETYEDEVLIPGKGEKSGGSYRSHNGNRWVVWDENLLSNNIDSINTTTNIILAHTQPCFFFCFLR